LFAANKFITLPGNRQMPDLLLAITSVSSQNPLLARVFTIHYHFTDE
jgi:hypothetical protein